MLIDVWGDDPAVLPVPRPVRGCGDLNHTWEIYKVDCECILEIEKEVHDVIKCASCELLIHETPYYAEGK